MKIDTIQSKIVSFKTTSKLWDEFVATAHQNGVVATNILAALIEGYIAGEYLPSTDFTASSYEPETPPDLTGTHVLVLDDELNIRMSITSILEYFGATVTAIASPVAALQTLQANPQIYDVLLSDIGMPEQDGWSFIRQVRALSAEAGGKIPAAALTAFASPREIDIARRLGFQVHLAKPVDAHLLAKTVADLASK